MVETCLSRGMVCFGEGSPWELLLCNQLLPDFPSNCLLLLFCSRMNQNCCERAPGRMGRGGIQEIRVVDAASCRSPILGGRKVRLLCLHIALLSFSRISSSCFHSRHPLDRHTIQVHSQHALTLACTVFSSQSQPSESLVDRTSDFWLNLRR